MLMLLVAHNRLYPLLLYCGHAWLFVCVEDFRDIQSDCEFGMLAVEAADVAVASRDEGEAPAASLE